MGSAELERFLNFKIGDCLNFKWKEALWLNQWGFYALPNEDVARNIMKTAEKMDMIRGLFGQPVIPTSWYRPEAYNKYISGSKRSAHILGLACDFVIPNYKCDYIRKALLPHLDNLMIRMENLPGADWVHIDLREPGITGRFFKP